jgi:acetyl esterase
VYATRLEDAGVPVTHRRYDEMIHGFASMLVEPDLDQARETIADIGGDLQEVRET